MGDPRIQDTDRYDFDRLERALVALVEERRRQREENLALRRELDQKRGHVRALEEKVLDANQRRQDAIKRVDELITQIDALDGQLSTLEG